MIVLKKILEVFFFSLNMLTLKEYLKLNKNLAKKWIQVNC